jgi:hypothetical protein
MIGDLRPWLVLACLVAAALPALGQETAPPLPEPNPARERRPTETAVPVPEEKPNLPGDQPTVAWTDPKVVAAREACAKMLSGVTLDYEQLDPIKKGICGAPAPILVKSIGKDPAVVISPPATMTCALAVALSAWLGDTVQPAAAVLGSRVVKMRNASSYKCRNRYGGANTPVSEHALANALDISEFVFASGQSVKILGNWPYGAIAALPLAPAPPQPNPRRVAAAWAAQDAKASRETTGAIVPVSSRRSFGSTLATVTQVKSNPFVRPVPPSVASPPQSPLPQKPSGFEGQSRTPITTVKSNPFVSPLPAPGVERNAPEPIENAEEKVGTETDTTADRMPPPILQQEDRAAFVRAIHNDACKTFETVLGPNSNEAHKDHFHFDMKKRRYVKICE